MDKIIRNFKKYGFWLFMHKICRNVKNKFSSAAEEYDFIYPVCEQELKECLRADFLFSILIPLYNTPESFLRELIKTIQEQTYKKWELCFVDASPNGEKLSEIVYEYQKYDDRIKYQLLDGNMGIAENTNVALEMATGDIIALMDHDDLLEKDALEKVAQKYICDEEIDVVYTDEDKISMNSTVQFDNNHKPDFNLELLRHNNYICHFFTVKCDIAKKIGGLRKEYDGAQDYDFVFRCVENARKVGHVPKILYHWRSHHESTANNPQSKMYAYEAGKRAIESHLKRMNINAKVETTEYMGFYSIIYELLSAPKISIVLYGDKDKRNKCISKINKITTYTNYCFENLDKVTGEYVIFLSNDLIPISRNWIEDFLRVMLQRSIGMVSGKIYTRKEKIYYAGAWKDKNGEYIYQFRGMDRTDSGYFHRQSLTQEVDGVSDKCIMISKKNLERFGEENIFIETDGVQYRNLCDRIQENGLKIIFQPQAEFYL